MGPWCGQMGALGWVGLALAIGLVVGLVVWVVGRLFPVATAEAELPGEDRLAPRAAGPVSTRAAHDHPERLDHRSGTPSR